MTATNEGEFRMTFDEVVSYRVTVKAKSLAEAKRMIRDGDYDDAETYSFSNRKNVTEWAGYGNA